MRNLDPRPIGVWVLDVASRLMIVALLGLVLCGTLAVYAATSMMERSLDRLALSHIDVNMRVAWSLLHRLGADTVIIDGKLCEGGTVLNDNRPLLEDLGHLVGGVASIFEGDERVATTITDSNGRLGIGTHLAAGPARDAILSAHHPYRGVVDVLGKRYYSGYDPMFDRTGKLIGALYVGIPQSSLRYAVAYTRLLMLAASTTCVLLSIIVFFIIIRHLSRQAGLREGRMQQHNDDLAIALENMANGLCRWSSTGTLIVANNRAAELLGFSTDLLKPGMTIDAYLILRQVAGHYGSCPLDEVVAQRVLIVLARKPWSQLDQLPDGRVIKTTYRPVGDGGWLNTFEDVTESERAEAHLTFMVRHDALTGLPNRMLFNERVEEALPAGDIAVFCLDLDRFKDVNDMLGHPVGDLLLKAVADRLKTCLRMNDTVARLGGDEFGIVLAPLESPQDGPQVAARIIEAIGRPFQLADEQITIGVSIGIALSSDQTDSADSLMKQADLAMYCAKAEGIGHYRLFEPEMQVHLQARRVMENELRKALAADEFELFYQPLLNIRTGSVDSFEALLRWRHPTRGLVSPAEFIPLAEATGLIVPIGKWVIGQACADAAGWDAHLSVAVNLSSVQFRDSHLLETVQAALSSTGLSPTRLELEITETVLLQESETTIAMLHELRQLGTRIALDDFGTGYSSLSYVRNFPFDKIKIDRSFVEGIGILPGSTAIISAVIGLSISLGIRTVAEGVETEQQLLWLAEAGCDEVQGFLFSPPRPCRDVPLMLTDRRATGPALEYAIS